MHLLRILALAYDSYDLMRKKNPFAIWRDTDLILNVYLQPKAAKNEIVGVHGDAIKIRIKAPPIDGKANAELQQFLAKLFKVPKSKIEFLSGELNRQKRIVIRQPKILPDFLQELKSPT